MRLCYSLQEFNNYLIQAAGGVVRMRRSPRRALGMHKAILPSPALGRAVWGMAQSSLQLVLNPGKTAALLLPTQALEFSELLRAATI